MTAKVVKAHLLGDTVSRTQNQVLLLNPGDPEDEEQMTFANAADIPRHMYMCLQEMMTGHDDDDFVFADSIMIKKGTDQSLQTGIDLCYVDLESVYGPDGNREDFAATRYGYLRVACRINSVKEKDFDLVEDMDLRIQHLIDAITLTTFQPDFYGTGPAAPNLDPTGVDITVDPAYGVQCTWLKNIDPQPSKVQEKISLYRLQFRRRFGH